MENCDFHVTIVQWKWKIFQEMVSETNKFRIQNFYKLFQFKKNSFIPNWTSIERRLLSISWKKITQSAPTHPPRYMWYEWNFPAGENTSSETSGLQE